jgi:hypothetical protein
LQPVNTLKWLLASAFAFGVAQAQLPDVRFHLDLYGAYDTLANNSGTLHLYDPLGNASTLQISVNIESGLRGYVSERLEQFARDPSRDPLEQYYVEDQGIWRLGKQYLPFGSGDLVRENVLAAMGQTNLFFENSRLALAVCDGGTGNQSGIVGRLGGKLGFSAAVGDRFGISPTSFDLIRSPNDSPGAGQGWKDMLGVDGSRNSGKFTTSGEAVWLLSGETSANPTQVVWDLNETLHLNAAHTILAGFSGTTEGHVNFLRLAAHIPWTKSCSVEPLLRYRDARYHDFALTLRVRL